METEEMVIVVDEHDTETGTMPKMAAHTSGTLHRAFSVFIFNTKGKLLLQKRAEGKYHSAGLWSNTCCSHPRPGEDTRAAAQRRLKEEMGIDCELEEVFSFVYKVQLENDLIEHEFDHVFVGTSDAMPKPDEEEVSGYVYLSLEDVLEGVAAHPDNYTEWFKICVTKWQEELFSKIKR
jgi:isopentenyl-diphosphate Delta-isomerase